MIPAIVLTPTEIAILIQLIDLAVKAGGLAVAEAAVLFQKRLQAHKNALDTAQLSQAAEQTAATIAGATPNVS